MLTTLQLNKWKMATPPDGVVEPTIRVEIFDKIETTLRFRVKWAIAMLLERILKEEMREGR